MSAIVFATTSESAVGQTLTFAENPGFPRSSQQVTPLTIPYRVADGTPYVEQVGFAATVMLTWPDDGPMTRANYASLLTFWSRVRGTQDTFTFTDDTGDTHEANFLEGPDAFTEITTGFVGSLLLWVRT